MSSSSSSDKPHHILVSTYTHALTPLVFTPLTGQLASSGPAIEVGYHPSWVTRHPDDGSVVFTGLEDPDGKIVSVKLSQSESTVVGRMVSVSDAVREKEDGGSPCHLVVTKGSEGDELIVANYSPGTVSIYAVSASTPYILSSAPKQIIRLADLCASYGLSTHGPNEERQEGPHGHEVVVNDDDGALLVADLGTDRVWKFRKEGEGGEWKSDGWIEYPAGSGPRHLVIHEGYVYTVLELTSELSVHRYPSGEFVTKTSTRAEEDPPSHAQQGMLAAEILIARSSPAYIYVSNRNDPHPEGDTIAVFSPLTSAAAGKLEVVAQIRTGLDHLRGMAFVDADERYIVAGGANGGGVKVFERVDGGRGLQQVAQAAHVDSPTGMVTIWP